MKFIHRLGYYLGGFAMGLIILLFFLNGKNASCNYGPNARTVANISSKPLEFYKGVKSITKSYNLDTTIVANLIKYGDVDFSKSKISSKDSCNTYHIKNSYKTKYYILKVQNCDSLAILVDIRKL